MAVFGSAGVTLVAILMVAVLDLQNHEAGRNTVVSVWVLYLLHEIGIFEGIADVAVWLTNL